MLVPEDGTGFDGFVKFVGIHKGLAFDFEYGNLALLHQAVEGSSTKSVSDIIVKTKKKQNKAFYCL